MQTSLFKQQKAAPLSTVALFFVCVAGALSVSAQSKLDTAKKLKQVEINTRPLPPIQNITPSQQLLAGDFDRYQALNVADAIRDFAGVNIKDYGGLGGLKTVSVRGLGAGHLAVLYDGVEISDAQNGQIDLGRLNLEGLSSISLYNGQPPQICMPARSFASASVLAINTLRPMLTAAKPYQVLLGIKGGSFGLINPYLQWQQRLSAEWSFVINGYWEKANGQYKYKVSGDGADTSSTRTNADVNAQEADGTLYRHKSDSNKFSLHINYYNSDRGLPGAVVFYNPTSNQRMWNKDAFAQSGYERLWQSSLHLLVNGKFSWDFTRYSNPDFLNNEGGILDRYNQYEYYGSAALSYHLTRIFEMSFVTDAALSNLDAVNATPSGFVSGTYQPSRFTLQNVLAASLVAGRWHLQGNLLHTYVNEWIATGTATPANSVYSPALMISFQPLDKPDLQLRAFYKDIFRNPTFDEQYYFAVNGSRNLKPEFAKQYDLGVTYRKAFDGIMDFIAVNIDGYYNRVTDKIIALPNQNPAIFSILNLGKVDITGVDAGFQAATKKSSKGWRGAITVNYTYQNAIDVTDPTSSYYRQQIPYAPKNTVALNGGTDYKQLGFYYNLVLSSSRYYLSNNDPQNLVDGYAVNDISLVYKLKLGNNSAVLALYANNIFNENYVIVRSFPMPGRSYLLSFHIKI